MIYSFQSFLYTGATLSKFHIWACHTQRRWWGRQLPMHMTCNTWSLQQTQSIWVNLGWPMESLWAQIPVCPFSHSPETWWGQRDASSWFAKQIQDIYTKIHKIHGKEVVVISLLLTELFRKLFEMQDRWIKSCHQKQNVSSSHSFACIFTIVQYWGGLIFKILFPSRWWAP